jgi:hypothetical protein
MTKPPTQANEEFIEALDALARSVEENAQRSRIIGRRLRALRRQVAAGHRVVDVVAEQGSPPIVELLTRNIESLHSTGSRFRWAQAAAMRSEGLTVTAIAESFGVTRQRISALLQQQPPKT